MESKGWKVAAVLFARLIMAALFALGLAGKLAMPAMMAESIAQAGFPFPMVLNWVAAIFELGLVLAFLTGAYFREASLLAAAYVIFLSFAFHFTSHWTDEKGLEFGAFVSHFPFAAGLLYMAVHGPGEKLAMKLGLLR